MAVAQKTPDLNTIIFTDYANLVYIYGTPLLHLIITKFGSGINVEHRPDLNDPVCCIVLSFALVWLECCGLT